MQCKIEDPFTYYNWQFLRRNQNYRDEFDRYAALLNADESKADEMLINLIKKWGMSTYVDWRDDVPDFLPNLFFDPLAYLGRFSYEELTSPQNPIDNIVELRPGDQQKKRFILMALDLENIRSKDYNNFWKTVLEIQQKNDLKTKDKTIERVVSRRKNLDRLLATYDEYVSVPSVTSYQIAQKLFDLYRDKESNTSSDTPSQHTKAVEDNIARAKELIALAPNIPFDFSGDNKSI